MHWVATRQTVPTIRALRDQAEEFRQHELGRAHKLLAKGEDPAKVLELLSRGLINKFLHLPSSVLNQATDGEREQLIELVNRLYQLRHPQ